MFPELAEALDAAMAGVIALVRGDADTQEHAAARCEAAQRTLARVGGHAPLNPHPVDRPVDQRGGPPI
jgi:hypothetical protein